MAVNIRYLKDQLGILLLWTCGALTLGIMLMITLYILWNGLPIISLGFLSADPIQGGKSGGIFPTIVATLFITIIALILSAPLSIGGAIYMAEYAGENTLTRLVRFGADSLAGIPSIIIGLFGYLLFVSYTKLGFSLISGSLAVAFMAMPIILRVSEEAIKVVPESYKHGSLAIGATKWQTIRKVVLPTAIPGIITGLMLGMGRVVGETAVFLLTTGSVAQIPTSLSSAVRPMTVHMYIIATENISLPYAFGTAATLLIIVLIITLTSNYITRRYFVKLGGRR
ncbi:MAG TPA: phosphate ABC transporter permease PstA [Methanocella sp.]|nr:phosphate ABC transporter permease PstA [Methanocella sp.]